MLSPVMLTFPVVMETGDNWIHVPTNPHRGLTFGEHVYPLSLVDPLDAKVKSLLIDSITYNNGHIYNVMCVLERSRSFLYHLLTYAPLMTGTRRPREKTVDKSLFEKQISFAAGILINRLVIMWRYVAVLKLHINSPSHLLA